MANEEREDSATDRQSLGELPNTLFQERGGFPKSPGDAAPAGGGGIPPDIQYSDSIQGEAIGAGLGAPVIGAQVQSVYDVRPINGRDFISCSTQLGVGPNNP